MYFYRKNYYTLKKAHILDTNIDNLSKKEVINIIKSSIKNKNQINLTGVNASKIVDMKSDFRFKNCVTNSDVIVADGQAVVWASKILNKPLKERVAGIDLMENVISLAYDNNFKVFFLGAKEEVVKKVVAIYAKKYTKDIIAGYHNGYFSSEQEVNIINKINLSKADILFVAMTSPKQEFFINTYKKKLPKVYYITEVGGSFDVVSGLVKRAPVWMQNLGLEWFFRFLQEPKRMWKRYLVGNSKFIWLVLKEKFSAK